MYFKPVWLSVVFWSKVINCLYTENRLSVVSCYQLTFGAKLSVFFSSTVAYQLFLVISCLFRQNYQLYFRNIVGYLLFLLVVFGSKVYYLPFHTVFVITCLGIKLSVVLTSNIVTYQLPFEVKLSVVHIFKLIFTYQVIQIQ